MKNVEIVQDKPETPPLDNLDQSTEEDVNKNAQEEIGDAKKEDEQEDNEKESEDKDEDNFKNARTKEETHVNSRKDKGKEVKEKDVETTKTFSESFGSSKDSLKNLLSMQLKLQLAIYSQLLQLPMEQANVDLDKISSLHELQLGDVFHAYVQKEIIETRQKSGELMDEVVKALQEAIPSANIDTSLSDMENLKLLIDYFKEYASDLRGKVEKEVEKKIYDKKDVGKSSRSVLLHTKSFQRI